MRRLARTAVLILLAASYVTLGIADPKAATSSLVWLPYGIVASTLAIINLIANGHDRSR